MELADRIAEHQKAIAARLNAEKTPLPPISSDNSDLGPMELPDVNVTPPSGPATLPPSVVAVPETAGAGGSSTSVAPKGAGGNNAAATGGSAGGNSNALPDPTPDDPIPSQIAARKRQIDDLLKQQGTEYVPDVRETLDNEQLMQINKVVKDFGAGFNLSLARTLALPEETVDRGMAMLGADYLQHGSPTQRTIDTMNRMGIPTYEVETLANKIGSGALPALATSAAFQLMAPAMAAAQGTNVAQVIARNMGEWLIKHPVFAQWVGQTSAAGGETLVDVTGKNNTPVRMGGEMLGGAFPFGGLKTGTSLALKGASKLLPGSGPLVRGAGNMVGKGIDAISDALPTDLANVVKKYNPLYKPVATPKDPLLSGADNSGIQNFAENQITSARQFQDDAIERAIHSVPYSGSPAENSRRMHSALETAEKVSKGIVSSFWRKTPQKSRMNVSELRSDVIKFRNSLEDLKNQRPDEMINEVMSVVRLNQEAGSGKFMAPQPRLAMVVDLKSQIGTAITKEKASDAPREGFIKRLVELNEIIDNAIGRSFPNNTSIEQARQMSKRHNDLFSRGPIDAVLSKRRSGDFRLPTADAVDNLLQRTDGLKALQNVRDGVAVNPTFSGKPSPFTKKASPAETAALDEMIKNAQDGLRATWRDLADQSPNKAIAYSQRHEDQIQAIGKVAGELQFASQRVKAAFEAKKEIDASSLAKFAETDGSKAVKNIFAQHDPAGTARKLMIHFRGDESALSGLRDQVLTEFVDNISKQNPNIIARNLKEPKFRNMLSVVLSDDQLSRLENLTATAVRLGVEDVNSLKYHFMSPVKIAGRVIGAHIGRKIAPGQLQAPSMAANAVGKFMENTMRSTDPQTMFKLAVVDPAWEALLHSRPPQNTLEMKRALFWYKRLYQTANTSQAQALKQFYDNSDE